MHVRIAKSSQLLDICNHNRTHMFASTALPSLQHAAKSQKLQQCLVDEVFIYDKYTHDALVHKSMSVHTAAVLDAEKLTNGYVRRELELRKPGGMQQLPTPPQTDQRARTRHHHMRTTQTTRTSFLTAAALTTTRLTASQQERQGRAPLAELLALRQLA
jgi:hypothetical protein